jgi:hypothetical protein
MKLNLVRVKDLDQAIPMVLGPVLHLCWSVGCLRWKAPGRKPFSYGLAMHTL